MEFPVFVGLFTMPINSYIISRNILFNQKYVKTKLFRISDHGIIEKFGLERTFRGHLVPTHLQQTGTASTRSGCSEP